MGGKGKDKKGKKAAAAKAAEPEVAASVPAEKSEEETVEEPTLEEARSPKNEEPTKTDATPEEPSDGKGKEVVEESGEQASQQQEELVLYPMLVKGPGGEELELQVAPVDTVMDLRQFIADMSETCFYTCYDLVLTTKDGQRLHLSEFMELQDAADVTSGDCTLEMIAGVYDDRHARAHVRRTRELIFAPPSDPTFATVLMQMHEQKKFDDSNEDDKKKKEEVSKEWKDGMGFMQDTEGVLEQIASRPEVDALPKCVTSIGFSSLNPVPSYRKLVGDLVYLDVVTLEGESLCITAGSKSFFVNSTESGPHAKLQPELKSPDLEATTLVGLLRKASPAFWPALEKVLELRANANQFEAMPVQVPMNEWLKAAKDKDHARDMARSEEALLIPYGSDINGQSRDWNEELQSCKDLPRANPQDRIMRDRALFKVTCDFVEAAQKGAQAVIGRSIPPFNPADPPLFHMYVYNGIFFSFALDADFAQLQQVRQQQVAAQEKQPGAEEEKEEVQPPPVTEHEQATYASANNDLKGLRAFNAADVPGLYTLAMAIIDYRGHRVVAQSIIPGILYGDKTSSLLYGSVDSGKRIAWDEKFHSKMLEAGKALHIAEHTVKDESGKEVTLCAPVESKGIVGADDRHYILDLMRVTPRDSNFEGMASRLAVLRPELVSAFCQAEAEERLKEAGQEVTESQLKEAAEAIRLNPNVLTNFKLGDDEEKNAADEALVRKASNFLLETVMPRTVKEFSSVEIAILDGQTLTELLHSNGINIRYLGKVAEMSHVLPFARNLCISEMVVRSTKHIFKAVLRETMDWDVSSAIAHFLNCFLGRPPNAPIYPKSMDTDFIPSGDPTFPADSATEAPAKKVVDEEGPVYARVTGESLWDDIIEAVKLKYNYTLPEGIRFRIRKLSALRNLCLKVGVTLLAKDYDLDSEEPFEPNDVVDLQPVVKHPTPQCSDAKALLELGKQRLQEGNLDKAFELLSEAYSLLQQVSGPIHRDVAACCRYLAMVHYHAGDIPSAVAQQHRELVINERLLGVDHPDTAHAYGNMALFYQQLGPEKVFAALHLMKRTMLLVNCVSGPDHPDCAATFSNIALMYQDLGNFSVALRYLQDALTRNERILGRKHIQVGIVLHSLAMAFFNMGNPKLAARHEGNVHDLLSEVLGPDDQRTKDSSYWHKKFKQQDQLLQARKDKLLVDAQKAAHAQAMAAAIARAGGAENFAKAMSRISGEQANPLRRQDERSTKAAQDARRKLEARSGGRGPRAASPDGGAQTLEQLLSFINNSHAHGAGRGQPTPRRGVGQTGGVAASASGSKTATPVSAAAPVGAAASHNLVESNGEAPRVPAGLGGMDLETKKGKKKGKKGGK